jgi:D-alanine transaminase
MHNPQYAELAELAGGFIHEIKNHLSTLNLNLQLLAEDFEGPQSPRERRALERVERLRDECGRLVDVANDFLRFARLKDLERQPADLGAVVDDMVSFFAPTAAIDRIEVNSYVPSGLPPVPLDVQLFKQALLNLLLNAQQSMPEGGEITLQAAAENGEVVLHVIDTGKGMNEEALRKAFKPFYSTRPGGTGLGLPTAKKIVEAHGGSLAAESAPGRGTRFTLRLPVHPSEGPAVAPLCLLNGQRVPLAEAKVSVLDRGFVFGDGIYEVLRFYQGRPWLEDEHFDRLRRSLEVIRIEGVDLARLRRQVRELIAEGGLREGIVYIQVTRGVAPRAHAFPVGVSPTELMWARETGDPYAPLREQGVTVSLQPDLRWKRCDVKSLNLLGNVLANQTAREGGHMEAILHLPDGTITEASHSSLFGVVGGALRTTALGPDILPGVTRTHVLRLAARAGVPVVEQSLHRDELPRVNELFLTGTSLQIAPILRVDDLVIGTGQPGPVTRRLQAEFGQSVQDFLDAPDRGA